MLAGAGLLMGIPEDHLIARCRAGDLEAFGQLYAAHEEAVFRHAFRLLGSREDALDACQETFVRAFQAMRSFRGECGVRLWLYRICTNQCRNQLRTRGRRRETSLDLEAQAVDPAPLIEQRQLAAVLREALARLTPGDREVVVLRDLEGLSARETAAVLGCAVASVPVKLFRARARLKEQVRQLIRETE